MTNQLHIAIDGPVAAGKGDIAARLAKDLGIVYVYTGAMYRALALYCIQKYISIIDTSAVFAALKSIKIELHPSVGTDSSACRVLLNDEDVTNRVTEPDVAAVSSKVAAFPAVREHMVKLQQDMANSKSVVMEGRDIGLRVLPKAQMKIYLTASLEERARRRWEQWKAKGIEKTLAETLEDTKIRDDQDTHRATDPLQKLPDAWELDTTGMTQDVVIQTIINKLKEKKLI